MIYMFLSNNPSSGDINSSNLSCLNLRLFLYFMSPRGKFYIFHLYFHYFLGFLTLFFVSGDFCCLLISFANSLFTDQYRQTASPDLDTDRFTL